jgi:hypothetical protein
VVSLGIFSVVHPTESCALRSTQPLKVITRDFSWGKGGRCVWLTNYHPCSAKTSRKFGALTYPEPLGPLRPVAGDLYFYLYFKYPACNAHAPYCYLWPAWLCRIFPHYLINGTIFEKQVTEHKMCVLIFSTTFV